MGMDLRGEEENSSENGEIPSAAAASRVIRANGGAGLDSGEKKRNQTKNCWVTGLYALAVGSPDSLKGPPDASGDHRSKTQGAPQNFRAPDDGHRTLDWRPVPQGRPG